MVLLRNRGSPHCVGSPTYGQHMTTTAKVCPTQATTMMLAHRPQDARLTTGEWFWVCPDGDMYAATREERGGPPPVDKRLGQ